MRLIGLPSTLPPKSSIAICAAVTEPWPVGVAAGPFMSVSTPILTTSSEICASAAVDASIAAAHAPNKNIFLANISFPPNEHRHVGRHRFFSGCSIALIGLICNYFDPAIWPELDRAAPAPCPSPLLGAGGFGGSAGAGRR